MSSVVSHKKFDATHQESYYAFRKQVEIKIDELKPNDFVSGVMLVIKKVDGGTELMEQSNCLTLIQPKLLTI